MTLLQISEWRKGRWHFCKPRPFLKQLEMPTGDTMTAHSLHGIGEKKVGEKKVEFTQSGQKWGIHWCHYWWISTEVCSVLCNLVSSTMHYSNNRGTEIPLNRESVEFTEIKWHKKLWVLKCSIIYYYVFLVRSKTFDWSGL